VSASVESPDHPVDLILTGHLPERLVVFDYHAEVADHRDALVAATARLAGTPVVVETLPGVLARAKDLPTTPFFDSGDETTLALLIYTSGSTGTPKGAMYQTKMVANAWRRSSMQMWGNDIGTPSITLNFMPMSHMMGRGILYATLGAGGTAYFVARSDLSTFLEDLALVRPTQLSFVPRIWDMVFQEFRSVVDRRAADNADRRAVETDVLADLRQNLLGGRFVSAMTGSAPISSEMKTFVESLLDCGRSLCRHGFDRILLLNGHGSHAPLVDIAARLPMAIICEKSIPMPVGMTRRSGPSTGSVTSTRTQTKPPVLWSGPPIGLEPRLAQNGVPSLR